MGAVSGDFILVAYQFWSGPYISLISSIFDAWNKAYIGIDQNVKPTNVLKVNMANYN